jgi:hypothetical protein
MGLLPDLDPNDAAVVFEDGGREIFDPVRDLAGEGADAIARGLSNVSDQTREAVATTFDKVAEVLASLGTTAQEYADALDDLTEPQRKKFVDFINAVDSLKNLRAEVLALRSPLDGIMLKDLLSGENKRLAIAMSWKTATFLNTFTDTVQMLNDLISLFGQNLEDRLRSQNIPILKRALDI